MDRAVRERGSYVFGRFRLDAARRALTRDGAAVALTPTVFDTLLHLVENPARVVTKEELFAAIWPGRFVEEANLTQTISTLRKALNEAGDDGRLIATAPGRGYRFTAEVDLAPIAASPVAPPPVRAEPLLAVLAFENLSGDPDMAYFSDGLSEEVLQTVVRGADIKVIGRASSFQFRGSAKAAANVAAELKATHVLDGSVQRSGDRIRIAAHLVECAGATTLWADRFDRDLTDVFALQDEIAAAVATALTVAFAQLEPPRPIDPAAYDLYLRARSFVPDGSTTAEQMLEEVVKIAPRFAAAWAALACARAWHGRYETPEGFSAHARERTVDAIETAVRLDPRSGLAFVARSHITPFGRYAQRERLKRQALAFAPNDNALLLEMCGFCASVGRHKEAFGLAAKAYQMDPVDPRAVSWFATCLFEADRREDSLKQFERARARWPEIEEFLALPLQLCAFTRNWKEFNLLAEQARVLDSPPMHVREALIAGKAIGEPNAEIRARVLKNLGGELDSSGAVTLGLLAFAFRLGLQDEVFKLVEEASFEHLFEPGGAAPVVWYNPTVIFSTATEMFRDPRFPRLCAKLGLCDYWAETDGWPDCADQVDYDFKTEARRLAGRSPPRFPERLTQKEVG